jgi:hypothetical protein
VCYIGSIEYGVLAKYAEVTLEIHLTLKRYHLSRFLALMCSSCTLAHSEENFQITRIVSQSLFGNQ